MQDFRGKKQTSIKYTPKTLKYDFLALKYKVNSFLDKTKEKAIIWCLKNRLQKLFNKLIYDKKLHDFLANFSQFHHFCMIFMIGSLQSLTRFLKKPSFQFSQKQILKIP